MDKAEAEAAETVRAQRTARVALGAALLLLALWTLRSFLPALAWAAVIAIATWPLYRRCRRRWPARGHGVLLPALFTLAIALVFLVPLAMAVVQLGVEARGFFEWLRAVQHEGVPVPDWVARLPVGGEAVAEWWDGAFNNPEGSGELLNRIDRARVVAVGREVGAQVLHRLVLFGFTLLTLFFLFRDGDRLAGQMLRAGSRAFGRRGELVAEQVVASVHGTVSGLVLVGLGEGVLLGVAYAVARVPHPTLFAAATAVAAMIPFGAPLLFGAASLWLLARGGAAAAAAVFGFGMAVVFVADHFVRPALIGGATRLPFLWVLLGILGGVEAWGLLGLFLGPAIMAALILLWRDWTGPRPSPAEPATGEEGPALARSGQRRVPPGGAGVEAAD